MPIRQALPRLLHAVPDGLLSKGLSAALLFLRGSLLEAKLRAKQRLSMSVIPLTLATLVGADIMAASVVLPAQAAERISFDYGLLSRSIDIQSLEAFAADGTVDDQLSSYFAIANLTQEERVAFRSALQEPATLDPLLLSRFFYTNIGDEILTRFLGDLIRTESRLNGKYSLRAALILAAQDEEGLSVLSFLRHLPTNVRIDLQSVFELSETIRLIVDLTQFAVTTLDTLSGEEAQSEPAIAFESLPRLDQLGDYGVATERWTLTSTRRNPLSGDVRERQFYVEVFRPQRWRPGKTPVLVFSHGLASRPADFIEWGEHMASHGYVVAMPQHPGSDTTQTRRFQRGLSSELFLVSDFVDRPKDVSDVIDELERRNEAEFEGRLALNRVGVGGHSFGGYTALAVAGATLDFEFLARECSNRFSYLNTSLLLQCQAMELPQRAYQFRDERVQAIAVLNPVNSSIYGPSGLSQVDIPITILAGSHDPATPAVFEQFRTFPWFTTKERYLGLIEGQAHVDFSKVDAGITETINSVEGLTLADPNIIQTYANAFSLGFFEVHVMQDENYRPYLQASYASFLSQGQPFGLHVISAEANDALIDAFNTFIQERNLDREDYQDRL